MSILDRMGRPAGSQSPQDGQNLLDPMQKLREIQQAPSATLAQANLNIPQGYTDPRQIADYMVSSGQVSPANYNRVARMLGLPLRQQ